MKQHSHSRRQKIFKTHTKKRDQLIQTYPAGPPPPLICANQVPPISLSCSHPTAEDVGNRLAQLAAVAADTEPLLAISVYRHSPPGYTRGRVLGVVERCDRCDTVSPYFERIVHLPLAAASDYGMHPYPLDAVEREVWLQRFESQYFAHSNQRFGGESPSGVLVPGASTLES